MAYTVIEDHGIWRPYTPDPLPDWAIQMASLGGPVIFFRRESDGVDFYEWMKTTPFEHGTVVAQTMEDIPGEGEIVKSAFRDETMLSPHNMRIIEIEGADPNEPDARKLFAWMKYDPETKTLSGEPVAPQPPVMEMSVSAAQALIQLSRMPHDGSVVPGVDNLLDATEALVDASKDRELKTWFYRAQRWIITNPNVQKIGAAFNMSQDDIKAAFDAASKIEE